MSKENGDEELKKVLEKSFVNYLEKSPVFFFRKFVQNLLEKNENKFEIKSGGITQDISGVITGVISKRHFWSNI